MGSSIKAGDMAKEIKSIFSEFEHSVNTAVDRAAETVGKEAVKKLKKNSPERKPKKKKKQRKHYKDSWKRAIDKRTGKVTVYNEQYQLTHLLENGHNIVRDGVTVGWSSPRKHIAPVEEYVQEEFPEEFERQVQK